jgi:phosphoribosylformylglycinamidine cyclo-ligase
MNNSRCESYAAAGVDITAGYKAVELMKQHIARTITSARRTPIIIRSL